MIRLTMGPEFQGAERDWLVSWNYQSDELLDDTLVIHPQTDTEEGDKPNVSATRKAWICKQPLYWSEEVSFFLFAVTWRSPDVNFIDSG